MPRNDTHGVKPIERFPAKPRRDGRFVKRIRGKLHYFGRNGDRVAALREYNRVREALYAGSLALATAADQQGISLTDVASSYLGHLREEYEVGRRSEVYYLQSGRALARFVKFVGQERAAAGLTPDDFARYGRHLSKALGDHAFNRERTAVITMFRYADECGLVERVPRMGRGFKRVPPSAMREQRRDRLVDPSWVIPLLAYLPTQLEAMLLLALNCGYGCSDCGQLKWSQVDLDGGTIRGYRRPKTKIDRDSILWPEAVESLKEVRAERPDDDLVFRTIHGNPWEITSVTHELRKYLGWFNEARKELGLPEVDFVLGDARHSFATFAGEAMDSDAWKRLMGHRLPGLKDVYIETLMMERLRKVVEHVRRRVFQVAQ